jgi:hypothetical protein
MNPLILIGLGDFGELCVRYSIDTLQSGILTDIIIREPESDNELKEKIPCETNKKWIIVKSLTTSKTIFQFAIDNFISKDTFKNNYSALNKYHEELLQEIKMSYNIVNEVGTVGTPIIILFSSTYDYTSSVFQTVVLEQLDGLFQTLPFSFYAFMLLPEMLDQDLSLEVVKVKKGDYSTNEVISALYEHLLNRLIEYKKLSKGEFQLYKTQKDQNKISIYDIKQGQTGDCYFLSTIGGIALKKPEHIQNMIIDHGDETFTVRFFSETGDPIFVTVDSKIWVNQDGTPVYSGSKTDDGQIELWPMILEKAWAKLNDKSYDKIQGDQNHIMSYATALTGKQLQFVTLDEFEDDTAFYKKIKTHFIEKNLPVCFVSREDANVNIVVPFHAYTLEKIEGKTLNLYNPWGEKHLENIDFQFINTNFNSILLYEINEFSDIIKDFKEITRLNPYRSISSLCEIECLAADCSFTNYFFLIDGYNSKDSFIGKIEDIIPSIAEVNNLIVSGKIRLPGTEIHEQAPNRSNAYWLAFGSGALIYPEDVLVKGLLMKSFSHDLGRLAEKLQQSCDVQAVASEVKGFFHYGSVKGKEIQYPVLNNADELMKVETETGKDLFIPFRYQIPIELSTIPTEDFMQDITIIKTEYENTTYNQLVLGSVSNRRQSLEAEISKALDDKTFEHLNSPNKGLNYSIIFNKLLIEDEDTIKQTGLISLDESSLGSLKRKLIAFYRNKYISLGKEEKAFDEVKCLDVDYRKTIKQEELSKFHEHVQSLGKKSKENDDAIVLKKSGLDILLEKKRKFIRNYFIVIPILLILLDIILQFSLNPFNLQWNNLTQIINVLKFTGLFLFIYYIIVVVQYSNTIMKPLGILKIELAELETQKNNLARQIIETINTSYKEGFLHHVYGYIFEMFESLQQYLQDKIDLLTKFKNELLSLNSTLLEEINNLRFDGNKFRTCVISPDDISEIFQAKLGKNEINTFIGNQPELGDHFIKYVRNDQSLKVIQDEGYAHFENFFQGYRKKSVLDIMQDRGKQIDEEIELLHLKSLPFLRFDDFSGYVEGSDTLLTFYSTEKIKVEIEPIIQSKNLSQRTIEFIIIEDKNRINEIQVRPLIKLGNVRCLTLALRNLFNHDDSLSQLLSTNADKKFEEFTAKYIYKIYPKLANKAILISKGIILKLISKEDNTYSFRTIKLGNSFTETMTLLDRKARLSDEISSTIDQFCMHNTEKAVNYVESFKAGDSEFEIAALQELKVLLRLEDE